MKYMGSKRAMLRNGLGTLLEQEISTATRFVDLFTGSATVANHVAQKFDVPVLASDLQSYSIALASAVIGRTKKLNCATIWDHWLRRARIRAGKAGKIPAVPIKLTIKAVLNHREWCATRVGF